MFRKSVPLLGLILLPAAIATPQIAQAQTLADIKAALGTATASPITVTVTSNPVVTQIIATAATYNTVLLQDSTGAIEAYKIPTTLYTPVVGDTVSLTASFTSFHGLYEVEATYTSVTKTGTAALPAPSVFTTTGLTDGSSVGLAQQSTLGTLSGVSFTTTGTFASGGTYTVSDSKGSATIYVPSGDAIIGQAIPTGVVNIYGYLGQYDTAATAFGSGSASTKGYELDPLSVTAGGSAATPEPGTLLGLLSGGSVLGMATLRRRKR